MLDRLLRPLPKTIILVKLLGFLCLLSVRVPHVKAAAITIDETKQLWAASAPVLGGYVVLCESIAPQQGSCGTTSFSDIVVFNGTSNISYFSDADTSGIPFFGDHDPADVGFGAFGPTGLTTVASDPRTVYFDETATFTDSTGKALPAGTIVYTPAAGGPGFPVAAGVVADTFTIQSDCSDCSCGGCAIPEPSSLLLCCGAVVAFARFAIARKRP